MRTIRNNDQQIAYVKYVSSLPAVEDAFASLEDVAQTEAVQEALEAAFIAGQQYAADQQKIDLKRVPEGLNLHAWAEWLQYRKALGKGPYKTDRVARWLAQYKEGEQKRIIDQSIQREWVGLFPLKDGQSRQRLGASPTDELGYL